LVRVPAGRRRRRVTTIVYRDGVMACDSQVTCSEVKYAKAKKIRKLGDGSLLGVSGNWAAAYRLLMGVREDGTIPPALLETTKGAGALFIRPDRSMWCIEGGKGGGVYPVLGPYLADGSGFLAAMAAMMGGADAVKAVQIACELDVNSSLPVYAERLGELVKPKRRKGAKGK
jgi:hypothetical protein